MNVVIFSDPHFSFNPSKSYTLSNGMNSWLQEQLNVVESIFDYCIENNVQYVICLGDIFEDKNLISQELYNIVWYYFKEKSKKFDIIFNIGNHDIYAIAEKSNTLAPFSDIIKVVTKPEDFRFNGYTFRIVPFNQCSNDIFNKPDDKSYLLLHEEIEGVQYGNYSNFKKKKLIGPELFKQWDLCISGHIHTPQEFDNFINIGSIVIQSWKDTDVNRRFLHLKEDEVKSIELDHPGFIELSGLNDKIRNRIDKDNRNFYRVLIDSSQTSDTIFQKFNVVFKIVKEEKDKKVRIEGNLLEEEEISKYVDSVDIKLDKNKLKRIGGELLWK